MFFNAVPSPKCPVPSTEATQNCENQDRGRPGSESYLAPHELCVFGRVIQHLCHRFFVCKVRFITAYSFYFTRVYFTCMGVPCACMLAHHMYVWCPRRSEEGFRLPQLELQRIISYNEDAENRAQVLPKGNWCSLPLDHLSNPEQADERLGSDNEKQTAQMLLYV